MPALTIAFDDGYLDTVTSCFDLLKERGIKATFAVSPFHAGKTLEERPVVSKENISCLIEEGHEIASHSMHHVNMLDVFTSGGEEAVREEFSSSKEKLEELTSSGVNSFVFPFIENNSSSFLRKLSSKYYSSSRITTLEKFLNPLKIKDPYSIVGVAVTGDSSLEWYEEMILEAIKKDMWLVEVFHLVSRENTKSARRDAPYRFFTQVERFKKHLDFIKSKDIEIITQGEGARKYSSS